MPTRALAGDYAYIEQIGFSDDGRYFAFEEFGEEDGTDFPFATIFIVDLKTDGWREGTPIRVVVEQETARIAEARRKARHAARNHIDRFKFLDNPGLPVFARGIAEPTPSDGLLTKPIPDSLNPLNDAPISFQLRLSTFELPGSDGHCPNGFSLAKLDEDGKDTVLRRDEKPVESRGCTYGYRLSRVYHPGLYRFRQPGHARIAVAIVSIISMGWEGADRRFIAIPVPLD